MNALHSTMPEPVTLDALNQGDEAAFVAAIGPVFEHSTWVAQAAAAARPYASVAELHTAMLASIRALPEDQLVAFLALHPELAGAQARAGDMTEDSQREQGGLSLSRLAESESARWEHLNAAYRARFGFPFILCVRRHTRASALAVFTQRLPRDRATEIDAALDEITLISRLRLAARIHDHGLDRLYGQLTVQVLDTLHARPAAQLRIALHETGGGPPLANIVTGVDGSPDHALVADEPLRMGNYELRVHVGDYLQQEGWTGTSYFDVVPIAFRIHEPEAHYHIPIRIGPRAYQAEVLDMP